MPHHTHHPLQPFWNIAAAPLQSQALDLALQRHLFALLQQTPQDAEAVARRLELNPRSTAAWLDLLWSMELLVRHVPAAQEAEAQFSTSPLAARFFVEASAENCTQSWQYRSRFLGRVATQLEPLLKEGSAPDQAGAAEATAAPTGTWAQAAREQIGQEQRTVTVPAVQRLLATLPPLPQQGRFLDLGAGPGHIGLALAQQLPQWRGTLCDTPDTAEVVQDNLQQAGFADRVEALGCDLDSDPIGSGYDLIWCSSVLHFLKNPLAAVSKMYAALNPGGVLILAHAELPTDASVAAQVLPFYTPMILRGHYLPRQGDIAQLMANAGFQKIRTSGRIDFPMAPVWLHIGQRDSVDGAVQ